MKKNIWINLILIIFICVFLFSGYNVFIWIKSDKETKELEEGLYTEVVSEVKDNELEENALQIDFEKLKSTNEDIIAWITIDNTYINYPILQSSTEDEYYLRKDIYKKYSVSGSIFVDSQTNSEFNDDNTIIYGHNMKNERMFANLHKINNGNLGTDINVKIYTEDNLITYKVFASYSIEPTEELIRKNFLNQSDKENYINNAIKKSNIKFDVSAENINYENKIVTLITCDNNNKRRVVVHAIQEN